MDTDTAIWILGVLCHKILLPFWFLFNYLKMQKLFFTCGLYQSRWQTRSGLWAIACQPPTGTFNAVIDMVGFKSANLIFVFYLSHLFFVLLSLFSSLLLDLLRAFCSALCPLLTCWPYLIILFFSVVALGLQYASLMIIKYFQVILCHFAEGMRPLQQYMFIFPSHPLNYRCHIYYFYLWIPQYFRFVYVCLLQQQMPFKEIFKMRNMSFIFTHTSTTSGILHSFMYI